VTKEQKQKSMEILKFHTPASPRLMNNLNEISLSLSPDYRYGSGKWQRVYQTHLIG
jgi:hypothetical protein